MYSEVPCPERGGGGGGRLGPCLVRIRETGQGPGGGRGGGCTVRSNASRLMGTHQC